MLTSLLLFNIIEGKLRATVEQLENELHQCKDKITFLNKILEEKEKLVNDYENRLIVNNRKHALELHTQYDKQRQFKIELEQRSTLIAQLTNQIHREKQHQQDVCNRIRLGQIILPNKPTRFKNNDEQQQQQQQLLSSRRLSNRSSSLSTRIGSDEELAKVLFIGRRPPTPPQQLHPLSPKSMESNDEQFYTKRQRQLLNNHTGNMALNKATSSRSTNKLSTVLPPIINRKMPLKAFATTTIQREGEA
jgi:transcriptional regulator with GAF, ATPase, and Fis domain